jgi:serine/threonine-protein kinase
VQVGVKPGDVLGGKYRVERVLGAGGMGVVVAARHLLLDQRVALKFMRASVITDEGAVERFLREARAVVRLRGEHVARVFDVGKLDDGAPYIVMEYLDGRDLGAVLQRSGALAAPDAVDLVLGGCVGVAEAHRQGIVHRDLKPQNLFLTRRPDGAPLVKVLDFGVSKMRAGVGASPGAVTGSAVMMGSPSYMAPEQMRSARDVDERADIWALGVILYELLSSALPFDGESLAVICAQVLAAEPRPLAEVALDVPHALAAVVERCLRKEPDERYADIAALAVALAPFASERGRDAARSIASIVARPRTLEEDPAPGVDSSASTFSMTTQSAASGEKREARRRVVWSGLALVVAAGAAVTFVFGTRRAAEPAREPAAAPTRPVTTAAPAVPPPIVEPLPLPAAEDAGVAASVPARVAPAAAPPARRKQQPAPRAPAGDDDPFAHGPR